MHCLHCDYNIEHCRDSSCPECGRAFDRSNPTTFHRGSPPIRPKLRILAYLGISLASSFCFAITWVILMTLTLPKSDMAHGQMPFEDALVFPIMSMLAGISALLAWPFYIFFGWRHPPLRFGVTAGAATLVFIIVATPFNAGIGWGGSYLVLLVTLSICRLTMKEDSQQHAGLVSFEAAPIASPDEPLA